MKKILAIVLSLCTISASIPVVYNYTPANVIAASDDSEEHKMESDGIFTYMVYKDHAQLWEVAHDAAGDIIVPASFKGLPVTEICGFSKCYDVTSVTIPSSVKVINYLAFEFCGLKKITLPESVTEICSQAFAYSNIESIEIPNSVKTINSGAFMGCSSLTEVNLPDELTSIQDNAFSSCSSLEEINIPKSVTSIGESAFGENSKLKSITIPDSVEIIKSGTFASCSSLESVKLPENLKTIEGSAFYNCSALKTIEFPEGVTSIGTECFFFSGLTGDITIPASVQRIDNDAFLSTNIDKLIILNPDCEIKGNHTGIIIIGDSATSTTTTTVTASTTTTITSTTTTTATSTTATTTTSTAPKAKKYGDANLDGNVSVADAVAIMQFLGNKDKYDLSAEAKANADCFNTGDGITGNDALTIQKVDAGLIKLEDLPIKN